MRFIPFLLMFLVSTTVSATVIKTEEKGNSKKLYLDYNSDKKIDLIEIYHKNELVKKEQDMDYDGSFDEVTEYFPFKSSTEPIETIKKSDRLTNVYRNEKLNKIVTTTQVDTDGDGKYDRVVTDSQPLIQKRDDPCKSMTDVIPSKISSLFKNVNQSVATMNKGYYVGEPGYKVHKSCLDNWGAKAFPEALSKAKNGGLMCLKELADKNTKANPLKPNGALNNLNNLNRLYANTPVSIMCNEKDGKEWKGVAGHASTSPGQKIKSLNITHPYLSINPTHPKTAMKPADDELAELSRTIFHEQLHNLGIRHGEGIEYPYACETCCLGDKTQDQKITDSSCKICSGQYDTKNKKDTTYLSDLTVWAEATYNYGQATKGINRYQLENPNSQWGIIMQARTMSGVFSPTGIEMTKILKQKFKSFSKGDEENLKISFMYENDPYLRSLSSRVKPIAQANIDYYYDNDPRKSIAALEKNKAHLLAIVKNAKSGTTDSEKYTNETLYKDTNKILTDIFIQGYPDHIDKESSSRAYALMKEIGID